MCASSNCDVHIIFHRCKSKFMLNITKQQNYGNSYNFHQYQNTVQQEEIQRNSDYNFKFYLYRDGKIFVNNPLIIKKTTKRQGSYLHINTNTYTYMRAFQYEAPFKEKIFYYYASKGYKEYKFTGGVPQAFVLRPLLWNIMQHGVLRLKVNVHIIGFADGIAVVVIAKHVEEIITIIRATISLIGDWLKEQSYLS